MPVNAGLTSETPQRAATPAASRAIAKAERATSIASSVDPASTRNVAMRIRRKDIQSDGRADRDRVAVQGVAHSLDRLLANRGARRRINRNHPLAQHFSTPPRYTGYAARKPTETAVPGSGPRIPAAIGKTPNRVQPTPDRDRKWAARNELAARRSTRSAGRSSRPPL